LGVSNQRDRVSSGVSSCHPNVARALRDWAAIPGASGDRGDPCSLERGGFSFRVRRRTCPGAHGITIPRFPQGPVHLLSSSGQGQSCIPECPVRFWVYFLQQLHGKLRRLAVEEAWSLGGLFRSGERRAGGNRESPRTYVEQHLGPDL